MFAVRSKAARLAPAMALAIMLAFVWNKSHAAVSVTWDLTAPPDSNDANAWLLNKPDNTAAPAFERFLGHTATYVSGGFSLVVNAFYVLPSALADFQTAFIHRATGTNSALGVCDANALNATQTATICGGSDTTVVDGIGNIDILRLTLPPLGSVNTAGLLLFRNTDSYRLYCSDSATIDLGDGSAVVASGSGPSGTVSVQLGAGACDKDYVFVTPDSLTGQVGPDRGFRLSSIAASIDTPDPNNGPNGGDTAATLAVPEPASLSLMALWLLALGCFVLPWPAARKDGSAGDSAGTNDRRDPALDRRKVKTPSKAGQ